MLFDNYLYSRILHLLIFIVFPVYLLHDEKQHGLYLKLKLCYLNLLLSTPISGTLKLVRGKALLQIRQFWQHYSRF